MIDLQTNEGLLVALVMALFGSRLVRQCGLTGQVPVKSFHFFLLDSAAVTLCSGCWGGVACAAPVLSGGQGDDLRSPGVKQRAR